jgi:hypothetical protein
MTARVKVLFTNDYDTLSRYKALKQIAGINIQSQADASKRF